MHSQLLVKCSEPGWTKWYIGIFNGFDKVAAWPGGWRSLCRMMVSGHVVLDAGKLDSHDKISAHNVPLPSWIGDAGSGAILAIGDAYDWAASAPPPLRTRLGVPSAPSAGADTGRLTLADAASSSEVILAPISNACLAMASSCSFSPLTNSFFFASNASFSMPDKPL